MRRLLALAVALSIPSSGWAWRVEKLTVPRTSGQGLAGGSASSIEVISGEAMVRFDPATPESEKGLALAKVGALKTIKIKQTTAAVKRAGTPQQTLTALAPAAAATHEMFVLGPNLPADAPHEAGAAAAARLEALGKAILGQYESKMDTYRPQFRTPWNMTNTQRDDVNNASKTCKDLMNVETTFQQQLPLLAGSQGWPDQERFITESKERAANYNKLSQQFVVPKYTTIYY